MFKMNGIQKALAVLINIMMCGLFVAVPCGIGWLIELIFKVDVNYFIFGGVGLFAYVLLLLIAISQYVFVKKFSDEMDKELNKFDW
jgi:hypothetical protein